MRSLVAEFLTKPVPNCEQATNERALQLELGMFLRSNGCRVRFEEKFTLPSNILSRGTQKSRLDLLVSLNDKTTAIELKVPLAGQVPEQMFKYCADVSFLESIVAARYASLGCAILLTNDRKFWTGNKLEGIYGPFRIGDETLKGRIPKPTGSKTEYVGLEGAYSLNWKLLGNTQLMKSAKYLLVEC